MHYYYYLSLSLCECVLGLRASYILTTLPLSEYLNDGYYKNYNNDNKKIINLQTGLTNPFVKEEKEGGKRQISGLALVLALMLET
jgi:hypothetical protein